MSLTEEFKLPKAARRQTKIVSQEGQAKKSPAFFARIFHIAVAVPATDKQAPQ
jgi:hypothetical protein